jgi:5-methylcytosine-specific restriction enzyme subunit McrC
MDRVFEDFLTTVLTEALSGRGDPRSQFPLTLDEPTAGATKGAIQMKVDLVQLVDGKPTLALDAKYKVEGDGDNPNRFQMLAHCTALDVPVGWLVYAEGAGSASERRIRNTDITLVEYPLDLSADPARLLSQIHRLADRAWSRRARPPPTSSRPT